MSFFSLLFPLLSSTVLALPLMFLTSFLPLLVPFSFSDNNPFPAILLFPNRTPPFPLVLLQRHFLLHLFWLIVLGKESLLFFSCCLQQISVPFSVVPLHFICFVDCFTVFLLLLCCSCVVFCHSVVLLLSCCCCCCHCCSIVVCVIVIDSVVIVVVLVLLL